MRTECLFLAAVLAAALSYADAASARKGFEAENAAPFARSVACHPEFAPKNRRFDRPEGGGTYVLVMPYARDPRVAFVKASFSGGKFARGNLLVFGRKPQPVSPKEFERMRDGYPMFAVRSGTDDFEPVACFYPARKTGTSFAPDDGDLYEVPWRRLLDVMMGSAVRCGINCGALMYSISLDRKGEPPVALGTVAVSGQLTDKDVIAALRAELERRMPARKGMVSERDVVDFRQGGKIVYTPVKSKEGGR